MTRTKNETVPTSVLGEPERKRGMGDGKKRRKSRRNNAQAEEEDEGQPLTSHEKRAKEGAERQAVEAQMTQSEKAIKEDEHHKRQINRLLLTKLADNIQQTQICHEEWSNRLFGTIPRNVAPMNDLTKMTELKVIQDKVEQYPNFRSVLYCSLDPSLLIMYILFFFVLDKLFENTLLAVFFTYLVERLFRFIRSELGENNLVNKAHCDERFLI